MRLSLFPLLGATILTASCEHTAPYEPSPIEPLGPKDSAAFRQLTFNLAHDETPSGHGDVVVFGRGTFGREDGDRCVAFLPAEGGTLLRISCPGGEQSDDRMEVASEPVISPDGTRLAYVYARGHIGESVPQRWVVVAPLSAPDSASRLLATFYTLSDGRLVSNFRKLTWLDDQTLCVLAGWDAFIDGEPHFEPRTVLQIPLDGNPPTEVSALAGAAAYAPSVNGGVWFVASDDVGVDGSALRYLDFDTGSAAPIAQVPGRILDLADVAGLPLVLVQWSQGGTALLRLDPTSGAVDEFSLDFAGVGRRVTVASAGDHQHALIEIQPRGLATSDIWLWELP